MIFCCTKCKHKWIPRKPNTKICPKCKTTKWIKEETPTRLSKDLPEVSFY